MSGQFELSFKFKFWSFFLPPRSFLVHLADVRVEQLKRELAHLVEVLLHRLGLEHPAGGGGRGGGGVQGPLQGAPSLCTP